MTLLSFLDDRLAGEDVGDLAEQAGINRFVADEFFLMCRNAHPSTWDF